MKGKILAAILIILALAAATYFYLSNAIRAHVRSIDFDGFHPLGGKVFVPSHPVIDVYIDVENPTPLEFNAEIRSVRVAMDGVLVAKSTGPSRAKIRANTLTTVKVRLEITNTNQLVKTLFYSWILKKTRYATVTVEGTINAFGAPIPLKVTRKIRV